MKKRSLFFVLALIFFGCNTKSSVTDESSFDDDILLNDFDTFVPDVQTEDADLTDETTDIDDEMIEVDDEIFEIDDESAEIDDEIAEPDEISDEISDEDTDSGLEVPLAGFGEISGDCGFIDAEILSEESFYFLNSIDFKTDPYDESDYIYLTPGGQKILNDANLGGSSIYFKVFAYEMLNRCELAGLLKTESEIVYEVEGEMTDLLVNIDGYKIGVSVAKAVKFPFDSEYTVAEAQSLLTAKLSDIAESSLNVCAEDKWEKQILYVIAYSDTHAASIQTAYDSLDESVKGDTIVIVTVTNGDDSFLY
ncbi:MAG TPA: hypothetical protein PLZ43_10810 [bacterium]|nr:hypothetical protein [bacterium]